MDNLEKDNTIKSSGEARWYVVHTYSGHENKVKVNIEKLVENRGMQDLVLEIVVPTESCVEFKDNKKRVKTRKMFPGYVIIKMIVTNESEVMKKRWDLKIKTEKNFFLFTKIGRAHV